MSSDKHIVLRIREDNLDAMRVAEKDFDSLKGDRPHLIEIEPGVYRLAVAQDHAVEPVTP